MDEGGVVREMNTYVGTDTRAGYTSLSRAADIDLRDLGREGGGRLAGAQSGWGSSLAR